MIASALPFVQAPTLPVELPLLGAHTITVFGPLVAVGVALGHRLSLRFAGARGLSERDADRLAVAVAIGGFAMAHWVSVIFYYPEQVRSEPLILLQMTRGLSSVGGFIGGALTFGVLTWRRKLAPLPFADMLAYGLLAGFTIGRLGCTLVHDHPGAVTSPDAWLGVGPWPDGSHRYDLGLVELMLLIPLCTYVYVLADWRRMPPGCLTAIIIIAYAILRFPLDFLRAEDLRYGLFTPAQYACIAFAVAALVISRRRAAVRT